MTHASVYSSGKCHPTPPHSTSLPIPFLHSPFLFSLSPHPLPPLHLEVGPHIAVKGGKRLTSPSGSGQSRSAKRFLVHFQLFNGPLVTYDLKKTTKTGFYGFIATTAPAEKKCWEAWGAI